MLCRYWPPSNWQVLQFSITADIVHLADVVTTYVCFDMRICLINVLIVLKFFWWKLERGVLLHYCAVGAASHTVPASSTSSTSSQRSGLTHRTVVGTYDVSGATTPAGSLPPSVMHRHLQSPEYHLSAPWHSAGTGTPVTVCPQPASSVPRFRRPLFSMLTARIADKVCDGL